MGSQRVRHDWATSLSLFTFMHWRRKWQLTLVFLPGESQGWGSLVGCGLWSRTELDMSEVTYQQQQSWLRMLCEFQVYNTIFSYTYTFVCDSQVVLVVKNLPANAEDIEMQVWILGQKDHLEEGTATNSSVLAWRVLMDRGASWATVHSVAKSQTQLKQLTTHIYLSIIFPILLLFRLLHNIDLILS